MKATDIVRLADLAGCSVAYLQDTMQMVMNDNWAPGDDVDRDSVVAVLAGIGSALVEADDGGAPVEHKIDTTKPGSVFDG